MNTQTIYYQGGGVDLQGYLAQPVPTTQPRPGILIVHAWGGLDEHMRRRAGMLAELGYTAFAVDMYGGGRTASEPSGATELMNTILGDMSLAETRLGAAREWLAARDDTDASRIAAIGYCFGGAVVLHAARLGMDLAAVISFHGKLKSFHTPLPGSIKARILICHGGADVMVPDAEVEAFSAEMKAAGADYRFISYPGAMHGFTSLDATANGQKYHLPLAYDENADKQSWQDMQQLLDKVF